MLPCWKNVTNDVNFEIYITVFSFWPQVYALDLNAMALKEYFALAAGKIL